MRPTRLELRGFASFREPTVLDFTDVDLFVLSGPTGAGKSSIIDAMTFALYGSVPRYDNKNLVAPVISQGQLEARVQLDFTVGDDHYRAIRVVRRTKAGATTKEARLERVTPADTVTLAGTADELTAAVESLLGLTFDHFTTCVVLPQGAFQAFMHAKPKERQDLLIELLDLDIYRRIASMANSQARNLDMEVELLQRQLDGELAEATPEARDAARARVATLAALKERIESAKPKLDAITDEGRELRHRANESAAQRDRVAAVRIPDGVTELAERIAAAGRAVDDSERALTAATEARDAAESRTEDLPDPDALKELLTGLERVPELATAEATARTRLGEARTAIDGARTSAEQAAAATTAARQELEAARRQDLAHTLRDGLGPGDDCPVCERPIEELPDHAPPAATEDAQRALTAAEQAEREATTAHQRAEAAAARAEAELEAATQRREAHERDLSARAERLTLPLDAEAIQARIVAVEAVHRDVAAARTDERAARRAHEEAKAAVASLASERDAAWSRFDEVRDPVAGSGPPPVDRSDLAGAWRALADWAAEQAPELDRLAREAEEAVADATRRYKAAIEELRQACADEGLDASTGDPRDACVDALQRETHRLERLDAALERAGSVRTERDRKRRQAQVAKELGQLLNARRFEQWLLNRALRRLVVGASTILTDLSQGQYTLALDDHNVFQVIDHRNADEARSARTLSGGETFLASLALALALAEHVADLAAQGSARLDALFIDEGFGTLDADTLDTVATAIEELGSRGRMVGLVTHVQDLAERLPVRFQVHKTGNASEVERVTA